MSQIPPTPTNFRGAVDLSGLVNRPQASAGGAAGEAAPGEAMFFQGTDANFNDFIDLSMRVPVVVVLSAAWADPDRRLATVLDTVTSDLAGRIVLVQVDVDANPQLVQAFQAQSVPAVAGIVAGRPVQLFSGAIPEDQVRDVVAQLLELAAQNGVTGTAKVDAAAGEAPEGEVAEPEPEPLPPLHAEAYEAIDRGDYPAAIAAYKTAIAQDPRDTMAIAGRPHARRDPVGGRRRSRRSRGSARRRRPRPVRRARRRRVRPAADGVPHPRRGGQGSGAGAHPGVFRDRRCGRPTGRQGQG